MGLDSFRPRYTKRSCLPLGLLALLTGILIPAAGLPCPAQAKSFQEPPVNRWVQIRTQTPGERGNQSGQAVPKSQQGQSQNETGQQTAGTEQTDDTLSGIRAALKNVSSPDLSALGQAFDTTVVKQAAAPAQTPNVALIEVGDLDGDGIPEVVMKLPGPGERGPDDASPASPSSWQGLYLLSWDGAHWKASSLAASGQHSEFKVVRLGSGATRCIAVVNLIGEDRLPYPAVFQVRQHEAELLWDSQAGDNRYNPLVDGRIEFQDDPKLEQTVMVETGRADPGLLEFEPGGRRGFTARYIYHWDGESYVPVQTEYSPGADNSLYHFIAALHLHDFRSAYALIDPSSYLKTDKPSVEQFRQVIETDWKEFLDDQVFQALEAKPGSPDALAFELPGKHYVYRPTLSDDGRFLITGLERKVEMPDTDKAGDSR